MASSNMSMRFQVGQKAVYPSHGVGTIRRIETRTIAGQPQDFYVLQIESSGATLMVPTTGSQRTGMRRLISDTDIEAVFKILKSPGNVSQTTWNRRFREFSDKLRSGSVCDLAEVLRDLNSLKSGKDLSFGEKNMLDRARTLLIEEICAVRQVQETEVEQELETILVH